MPLSFPAVQANGTRVVVPFALAGKAQPWPLAAVRLALDQDGWKPEFRHMTHGESYYGLLLELWHSRKTFIVVEHDIVVWPGALSQLESCPEGWCTFPYYCSVGWIKDGLGCTKFSAAFIEKHPDLLAEPFPTCCQHTRNYCGLDRTIAHRMEEVGIEPHVHAPGVVNLNERWT